MSTKTKKNKTFGEMLLAERKRLGLTQAAAAELLDVSKRSVEEWERGKTPLAVTQEGVLARLKQHQPAD